MGKILTWSKKKIIQYLHDEDVHDTKWKIYLKVWHFLNGPDNDLYIYIYKWMDSANEM